MWPACWQNLRLKKKNLNVTAPFYIVHCIQYTIEILPWRELLYDKGKLASFFNRKNRYYRPFLIRKFWSPQVVWYLGPIREVSYVVNTRLKKTKLSWRKWKQIDWNEPSRRCWGKKNVFSWVQVFNWQFGRLFLF